MGTPIFLVKRASNSQDTVDYIVQRAARKNSSGFPGLIGSGRGFMPRGLVGSGHGFMPRGLVRSGDGFVPRGYWFESQS